MKSKRERVKEEKGERMKRGKGVWERRKGKK